MSTKLIFVARIEFVAMSMPLTDLTGCIDPLGQRAGLEFTRIRPKSHRSTHRLDADQIAQLEDHRMRTVVVEFSRIRAFKRAHVTGKLDGRALHAEANPEKRCLLTSGIVDRSEHP